MMNKALVISWFKIFLASSITAFIADVVDGGFTDLNGEVILIAGIVSAGPVIVNWLNPNDTRYGRGSEPVVNMADRLKG